MLEHLRYLAIEGPIGAGKTSLARTIAKRFGGRLALEPAAQNPFLEKFYTDMRRYAFATQVVFLVSRYQQQSELIRRYLFHPLVVSDYLLARDRIFAGLTLTGEEMELYSQLYEVIAERAAVPDLVVLLEADVDTLMERIRRRAVPCEAGLSSEYLERLVEAYGEYFRAYDESPLLVVNTADMDYGTQRLDVEALVPEMDRTRSGRRACRARAVAAGPDGT